MRTALISDIHGHYEGLQKVLTDIESQSCDRILCLGDLVEGGQHDDRVVETIRALEIRCVQGNHDAEHPLTLSPENEHFLRALPSSITEGELHFSHISARPKMLKIANPVEAWNVFDESPHRLLFTGHQHLPLIYGEKSDTFGEACLHEFEYGNAFQFQATERYIICVGAVAYGRDSVGKIRYAIYDQEVDSLEHRAIDGPLLARDYTRR